MRVSPIERNGGFVMRILLSGAVALTLLAFALPAFAQEQTTPAAGCDWYWWTNYNPAGWWEYLCWSPQEGWLYSESEEWNKQTIKH